MMLATAVRLFWFVRPAFNIMSLATAPWYIARCPPSRGTPIDTCHHRCTERRHDHAVAARHTTPGSGFGNDIVRSVTQSQAEHCRIIELASYPVPSSAVEEPHAHAGRQAAITVPSPPRTKLHEGLIVTAVALP